MADAPAASVTYARAVLYAQSGIDLAAVTAPLFSSFGDNLSLWRDGNVVHWSYDGQTVIVEQQADGAATAAFVDAPSFDEISKSPAAAIYRRTSDRRYHLTEESCRAMVGDMIAFFSGEREPFFTFVGARSLDA
jgi:hypothetical protein